MVLVKTQLNIYNDFNSLKNRNKRKLLKDKTIACKKSKTKISRNRNKVPEKDESMIEAYCCWLKPNSSTLLASG